LLADERGEVIIQTLSSMPDIPNITTQADLILINGTAASLQGTICSVNLKLKWHMAMWH